MVVHSSCPCTNIKASSHRYSKLNTSINNFEAAHFPRHYHLIGVSLPCKPALGPIEDQEAIRGRRSRRTHGTSAHSWQVATYPLLSCFSPPLFLSHSLAHSFSLLLVSLACSTRFLSSSRVWPLFKRTSHATIPRPGACQHSHHSPLRNMSCAM